MTQEDYSFDILHEVVAPNDLFPDETHENVASNLFELIQSSERGVTIGLEGGWGSGKSTVVNLLKNKLAKQDKEGDRTLFFLFDAWAHDGDPLRRIFLEGLVNDIDPEEEDHALNDLRQEISGRKKTVEVKTKKSTSKLGGWLSFSAIFVPVGAAILSAVNYDTLSLLNFSKELHWPFIVGMLLALAPLWVIGLWWARGEKDKNGERRWEFFVSDSEESYTQDITEDGERTSIEFERFFKQIMDHSVGDGKKYKQALIVVDNLDRVEPEQTLAIWSILQTFFQHRNNPHSNDKDAWASKLWFLVPYDREGLSQVWGKKEYPVVVNTTETLLEKSGVLSIENEGQQSDLAPSFLEKCFQIIAEVPEPVMSAWVEYAEATIKKALAGWPENSLGDIISTYKRFESRLESSPTPRQIQAFVNRVGMLGMRWKDQMSAEAIALYALVRRNRSDKQLRKVLLSEGLPDGYDGTADNYDLKMQLAGMLFGVDKDKGIQLLLKPEIHGALENGDSETLQSLIEEHGEAFWVVWQAIRESSLPNGHVEEYRIAVTKAFCRGVCNHKVRAKADIARLVNEWKRSESKWDFSKHDYSEALAALLGIVDPIEKQEEILTWLVKIVRETISKAINHLGGDKFEPTTLSNTSKIIEILKLNGKSFQRSHYPKLDQSKWKTWIEALDSQSVDIEFVLPAKGAIKALAGAINNSNPDNNTLELLKRTLDYIPLLQEWEDVAISLTAFANNQNHSIGIEPAFGLMSSMYWMCNQKVKDQIESCFKNPQFKAATQRESVEAVPSLLVLCANIFEKELMDADLSPNIKAFWQAEYDPEKCKKIIELLKEQDKLSLVWPLATSSENKVAIGMIRAEVDESIYSSSLGAEYVDEFVWATKEEQELLVSKLQQGGGLSRSRENLVASPVPYRGCLKLIKKHGGAEGREIVEDALKNTSADDWEKALAEDLLLVDCIGKTGDHKFTDCVKKLLLDELHNGELTPHIWGNFSVIYEKLLDKEDIAKDITELYMCLDQDPFEDNVFEQISNCLLPFVTQADSDFIMKRVDLWLSTEQWDRIDWLLSAELKIDIPPKEALTSRVISLVQEGAEEHQDTLLSIVKTFNIQIEDADEEGENV
jgi:hypothetical protein